MQQRVELAGLYSVSGGGFNLKFAREQAQVADAMMDFNHWYNPRDQRALAFRKRVEDAGNQFGWETLFGYFAVRLVADAMERAGSAEKGKLTEALAASTYSDHFMPYGPTKFMNGQNQGARASLQQVQKGDVTVIWPEEFAGAPAVFPRAKA